MAKKTAVEVAEVSNQIEHLEFVDFNTLKAKIMVQPKTWATMQEAKGWKEEQLAEQGRAIARGMTEENARKEKNQAKAVKRKDTMIRNAANEVFNY